MIKKFIIMTLFAICFIVGTKAVQAEWVLPEREIVECKGGAGSAIYSVGPVCYKPYCDIANDPSLGCVFDDIKVWKEDGQTEPDIIPIPNPTPIPDPIPVPEPDPVPSPIPDPTDLNLIDMLLDGPIRLKVGDNVCVVTCVEIPNE